MAGNEGARRAAALLAALQRTERLKITAYERLFADPIDPDHVLSDLPDDSESRRKALDRAVADLASIGVRTREAAGWIALDLRAPRAHAGLLVLGELDDVRAEVSRTLRSLHPANVVRLDPGAFQKTYLLKMVEVEYADGSAFTGRPYHFAWGPRPTVTLRCEGSDVTLFLDAITAFRVLDWRRSEAITDVNTPPPRSAAPGTAIKRRGNRGRPGDPEQLSHAQAVVREAQHASTQTVPLEPFARRVGLTPERLLTLRDIVGGIDARVVIEDEGVSLQPMFDRPRSIDGASALSARLEARALEALGVDARIELWASVGGSEAAHQIERELIELVSILDEFLGHLDLPPAPVPPANARKIVAMCDLAATEPWADGYPVSLEMQDGSLYSDVRTTGLVWSTDTWWVQTQPRGTAIERSIDLRNIVSCD